mgnify:CR=1 FL=1
MNWLEKHNYIYGGCLLVASICMLAFGGAYFGAQKAIDNTEIVVNVAPTDVRVVTSE